MGILFGILLPWGQVLWSADTYGWVSQAICTEESVSAGCKIESTALLAAHLGSERKGNMLFCGFRVKLPSSGPIWELKIRTLLRFLCCSPLERRTKVAENPNSKVSCKLWSSPSALLFSQLCCITIEPFTLNTRSLFTAPEVGDSCWHTNDHQLTLVILANSCLGHNIDVDPV